MKNIETKIPKMEGTDMHTKEGGGQELEEKFGTEKTADFRFTLSQGEIEKAQAWLQHIIDY